MPGITISTPEIVQVTRRGFWLALGYEEYFLDFADFPWFKKANIEALTSIEEPSPGHLHWPLLDVDLDLDCVRKPDAYPLIAKDMI